MCVQHTYFIRYLVYTFHYWFTVLYRNVMYGEIHTVGSSYSKSRFIWVSNLGNGTFECRSSLPSRATQTKSLHSFTVLFWTNVFKSPIHQSKGWNAKSQKHMFELKHVSWNTKSSHCIFAFPSRPSRPMFKVSEDISGKHRAHVLLNIALL